MTNKAVHWLQCDPRGGAGGRRRNIPELLPIVGSCLHVANLIAMPTSAGSPAFGEGRLI